MKISIIGCGYVGITAAAHFANAGHNVALFDSNSEKMNLLRKLKLPLFEKNLEALYKKNINSIHPCADAKEAIEFCSQIFIAVGTPSNQDGSANLSFIESVFRQIIKYCCRDINVIIKSTVPVGFTDRMQEYCNAHSSYKIQVIFNPEFLRQGHSVSDFQNPDRIIIGTSSLSLRELFLNIYKDFLKTPDSLIFMDTRSAELSKYAANAFLATKLSFINEMALLSQKIGANIHLVKKGFTSDHRINEHYFEHGVGYGGSCLPKDLDALIHMGKEHGLEMLMPTATQKINQRQQKIIFQMILSQFANKSLEKKAHNKPLRKHTFSIWGLTFKSNTDDTRESPSLFLIEKLIEMDAQVNVYDPNVKNLNSFSENKNLHFFNSPLESLKSSDGLIIHNHCKEFQNIDFSKAHKLMSQHFIFDGRNSLRQKNLEKWGFKYIGMGE